MGRELVVLGAAFLLAGLLARVARRVGLPTIPVFMAAGMLAGPHTPGPVLFEHPEDLELLAAFGLIFLLFYLGLEFSLDDITGGGRKLGATAAVYLGLNIGAGLALGFAIGWGAEEALVIAGSVLATISYQRPAAARSPADSQARPSASFGAISPGTAW